MYDKALSVIIHPDTAKHFKLRELKSYVRMQIVNGLLTEGMIVDERTKYSYNVLNNENVTVSIRAYREG